jgi:hypothetical protein
MFEFNIYQYYKIDVIDYSKSFSEKSNEKSLGQIRIDNLNTEEEMFEEAKSRIKADFHENSFFTWMLIVKRMLFMNLFKRKENVIIEENGEFNENQYEIQVHKLFEFRTLLFVIKSFMLFFNKIKELSNVLDTLKVFYTFDIFEREIKLIFKNLEKFFSIDSELTQSKKEYC